ncbi:hypothetical protein PGT21_015328 [Puccinia graminis f. sp. tritici]|uniref:Uncharacterized protein n=2 Tax=Puccinia graminis f. sp. tritici TaxID=56615 RepID=A0A5B0LKM2_PUCGR|nr:hypothetical protein PGT21_015328 [Puccinia graminis f. sp. tritici]
MPIITETLDQMSDEQDQDQETKVELYTAQISSTKELYSFVKAHRKLSELLQQKIVEFSGTKTRWEETKVTKSVFERTVARINTILVDSIAGKLHRLCALLFDSIYLQQLEAAQLRDGTKVLEELEKSVQQICASISSLWVPDRFQFFPNQDGEKERLRRYKSARVQSKLVDTFYNLNEQLRLHFALLPIPGNETITRAEAKVKLGELMTCIEDDEEYEEDLVKWVHMSDLRIVQEHWQEMAEILGDLLEELVEYPSLHKDIHIQPLHQLIPILKLSRLFFSKISKPSSDQSYPISYMSLNQLIDLINLTASIPTKLTKFYDQLECHYEPTQNIDLSKLSDLAKLFQAPLTLLINSLNHQTTNPNLPQRDLAQFIQWYADWQSHFSLAVRRFDTTYRDVYSDFLIAGDN